MLWCNRELVALAVGYALRIGEQLEVGDRLGSLCTRELETVHQLERTNTEQAICISALWCAMEANCHLALLIQSNVGQKCMRKHNGGFLTVCR
jgi:hypothetical protein